MIASGEAVDGDELDEEEMAELEEKLELDYQVGEDLKEKVRFLASCFFVLFCFFVFFFVGLVPFSLVWMASVERAPTFVLQG